MTPFKVLSRRDPPHVLWMGRGHTPVDPLEELLKDSDAILDDLHFHLMRAQHKTKLAADSKRREAHLRYETRFFSNYSPTDNVLCQNGLMRSWPQDTIGLLRCCTK